MQLHDAEGKNVNVQVVGSFPGIELKVNVKKLSSAPKISIDYVNRTMKIPKGALYRISFADGSEPAYVGDPEGWAESKGNLLNYRNSEDYGKPNNYPEIGDEEKLYNNLINFARLVEKGGTVEVKRKQNKSKLPSKIGCKVVEAKRNYNFSFTTIPFKSENYVSDVTYVETGSGSIGISEEKEKYDINIDCKRTIITKKESSLTKLQFVFSNQSTNTYQFLVADYY